MDISAQLSIHSLNVIKVLTSPINFFGLYFSACICAITNLDLSFLFFSRLTSTCVLGGFLNLLFSFLWCFAQGSSISPYYLPLSCNVFLPGRLSAASYACARVRTPVCVCGWACGILCSSGAFIFTYILHLDPKLRFCVILIASVLLVQSHLKMLLQLVIGCFSWIAFCRTL